MKRLILLCKGFIVGIGGVSPGLSGSILLVSFGLYSKTVYYISTIFKDFKKKLLFLFPLLSGMLLGVLTFSRIIRYFLTSFEIQTRLAFFGLLIGIIPLIYREVEKEGSIEKKHYIIMVISFLLFLTVFTFGITINPVEELNIIQLFLLGFSGIVATIIPGIEAASFMSTFGLYGHWLDFTSLSNTSIMYLTPVAIGAVIGGFLISRVVSYFLRKDYTITFSIIFGFFLSIVPNILIMSEGGLISIGSNIPTYTGFGLLGIGVVASLLFGKMQSSKTRENDE